MTDTNGSTEQDLGNANKKPPRLRSTSYPSYSLANCISLTEKIDKEFTSVVYTNSDDISKALAISGGSFLMQISSCVQYGLLEKKVNEGYKPTDLFKKISKPLPNESIRDLHIEAFSKPPLYKKLINEFKDKQLPSEKGLANILDRNYEVKGKAAELASKVFLKNLSSLLLIADGNILKFDSYLPFVETKNEEDTGFEEMPEQKMQILIPVNSTKDTPKPVTAVSKPLTKEIPVFLKGENREARLILPIDFTEEDLTRIVKVLNAYLP